MKLYFCSECGAYDFGNADLCLECQAPIPKDSWADVSDEDVTQLDYIEDFDPIEGLPTWEYEVIKLMGHANDQGPNDDDILEQTRIYNEHMLNRMGDKGWELVNIVPMGDKDGPRYGVFKRAWLDEFEE
ncbi:MAG: hypothetical protein BZY79_03005 [SAR202 cluster bacterium Casp-Chloro-G4]|nr:DUF4177 domain-containing protein [Chloroflexota bacterium]MDA1227734.1 DUF4177 domain-containing protein [Chloroflexota bacterium]PKB61535.1 MAG: hypothetical protein BZY79_03005 [SAR202 cluster bacterium Casp-Chloro-G4]